MICNTFSQQTKKPRKTQNWTLKVFRFLQNLGFSGPIFQPRIQAIIIPQKCISITDIDKMVK